jgi:hypothetical protein
MKRTEYQAMIDGRTDTMWNRYKDETREGLLVFLRRNQQAGRYLVAGDIAAIRAELEQGQTVHDLGKPTLRRILMERFDYVVAQQSEGRAMG